MNNEHADKSLKFVLEILLNSLLLYIYLRSLLLKIKRAKYIRQDANGKCLNRVESSDTNLHSWATELVPKHMAYYSSPNCPNFHPY